MNRKVKSVLSILLSIIMILSVTAVPIDFGTLVHASGTQTDVPTPNVNSSKAKAQRGNGLEHLRFILRDNYTHLEDRDYKPFELCEDGWYRSVFDLETENVKNLKHYSTLVITADCDGILTFDRTIDIAKQSGDNGNGFIVFEDKNGMTSTSFTKILDIDYVRVEEEQSEDVAKQYWNDNNTGKQGQKTCSIQVIEGKWYTLGARLSLQNADLSTSENIVRVGNFSFAPRGETPEPPSVQKNKISAIFDSTQGSVIIAGANVNSGVPVEVEADTNVSLSATPKEGYIFDGWYDGEQLINSNPSYSFTAKKDKVFEARFAEVWKVTVRFNGSAGSVLYQVKHLSPNQELYVKKGDRIKFYCIANDGSTFEGWYDGDDKKLSEVSYCYVTPTSDMVIEARFNKAVTVTVSFDANAIAKKESGTRSEIYYRINDSDRNKLPADGQLIVSSGSKVEITVERGKIQYYYTLSRVLVNEVDCLKKDYALETQYGCDFFAENDSTVVFDFTHHTYGNVSGYTAPSDFSNVKTLSNFPWTLESDGSLKSGTPGKDQISSLYFESAMDGVLCLKYKTQTGSDERMLLYRKGTEIKADPYSSSNSNYNYADNYNTNTQDFSGTNDWRELRIPVDKGEVVYFGYLCKKSVGGSVSLKDFKIVQGFVNIDVTSSNQEYGTVSGGGSHTIGRTITLTATPKTGCSFYGWKQNGKVISVNRALEITPTENASYEADFKPTGYYIAHSGMERFQTLEEAFDSNYTNIVLDSDYTLTSDLTIPKGKTLILPCKANDDGENAPPIALNQDGGPVRFRTVTVPQGKTLYVSGKLVVNAEIGGKRTVGYLQNIKCGYGFISNNGKVVLLSGGAVDCFGRIEGGSVIVKSGATLTDLYVIENWRGGSQAKLMYNNNVYPLNEYSENNITSPITIEYGATYSGFVRMYNSWTNIETTRFPQVDIKNGLIRLSNGSEIVKTVNVNGTQTREKYTINGSATFASSTLTIAGETLSTKDYIYPINGLYDFVLNNGTVTFDADFKFMPGATVTVAQNSKVVVNEGKKVVFYDKETFKDVENTGSTTYPSTRESAYLKLENNASLTINGAFAGTLNCDRDAVITRGGNSALSVSTKEANGYDNTPATVTITHNFMPPQFTGYDGKWSSNRYVWELKDVFVTLNANDGTFANGKNSIVITGKYGQTLTIPKEPTRAGYVFDFWSCDGIEWISTSTLKDDFTLVAVWKEAEDTPYSIVSHLEGLVEGQEEIITVVKKGRTNSSVTVVGEKRQGFTLASFIDSLKILADGSAERHLYYNRNSYNVSWNVNGGNEITSTGHTTGSCKFGATVISPENAPERTGYTFGGWENYTESMTVPANNIEFVARWTANLYTVSFNYNGGDVSEKTRQVAYDSAYGVLPMPTRTGYDFDGWYLGETRVDSKTVLNLARNVTLKAKWNAKKYTVSFDTDGGNKIDPITVEFGSVLSALDNIKPTKTGYKLGGWYYNEKRFTASSEYNVADNITLKAKWTEDSYTVIYSVDNVVLEDYAEFSYDQEITDLLVYKKDGYDVTQWHLKDGSPVPEKMPAKILYLYAETSPTNYSVAYKGLEGAENPEANPSTYTIETETFTIQHPSKTGYTFIGWTIDDDPIPKMTVTVNKGSMGNLSLTANWQVNKNKVTYIVDNDEKYSSEVSFGATVNVKPDEAKTGYTFSGWSVTGAMVENGQFTMPDNEVTFTGSFTANTYVVKFEANGGTGTMASLDATYNVEYSLHENIFVREGYTFNGWKQSGSESTFKDKDSFKNLASENGAEITLVAQWSINTYTITFDTDGGTTIPKITQDYNSEIVAPENPTKEGYEFVGWDKTVPATMLAYDITIKATWDSYLDKIIRLENFNGDNLTTARGYYKMLNESQKNSGNEKLRRLVDAIKAYSVEVLDKAVADAVEPTNNKLLTEDGQLAKIVLNEGRSADAIIFAPDYQAYKMTENEFLECLFGYEEIVGIKVGKQDECGKNKNALMLAVAKEANVDLSSFSDVKLSVLDGHKMDVVLRAVTDEEIEYSVKYSIEFFNEKHTVRWDANTGELSGERTEGLTSYNSPITAPTATKTGHDFVGWDNEVGKMGKKDITFTAQWKPSTYTLSFDSDGGTSCQDKKVTYNQAIGTLPAPTKTGYTFSGWYDGDELVTPNTFYVKACDTQLVAKWSVDTHSINYYVNGVLLYTEAKEYGSSLESLFECSRKGYIVSAWTAENNAPVPETMIDKDLNLYAVATAITYNISYNNVDGTELSETNPIMYTVETETVKIINPERVGYTFNGWSVKGSEVKYTEYSIAKGSTGDIELSANWSINSYDVVYKVAGITHYSTSADYYSLVELYIYPEKTGYTFSGWATDDAEIVNGRFTMPAKAVELSGSFTPNTYSVVFDANGGEGEMDKQTFTYDSEKALNANTFTKTGYSFGGWRFGDTTYTDCGTIKNLTAEANGTVTLVAQWNVNKYSISFNTFGGTTIDTITGDYGSPVTAPKAPEKKGYEFAGWDADIPQTMPANNLVINAKWNSYLDKIEALDNFEGENLAFGRNYYTLLNEEQLESDSEKLAELIDCIAEDAVTKIKKAVGDAIKPTNDTLYDGENRIAELVMLDGEHIEVRIVNPEYKAVNLLNKGFLDKLFEYTEVTGVAVGTQPECVINHDGTTTNYALMAAVAREAGITSSDVTLTVLDAKTISAVINAKTPEGIEYSVEYTIEFFNESHLVTWIADGGELGGDYTYGLTKYEADIVPPTASRIGYTFVGWKNIVGKMGKKDISFTATWTPNTYTVSFDKNGGYDLNKESIDVQFDTPLGTLATVKREGYTFTGWYYGDTLVNSQTVLDSTLFDVAKPIALKANWTANKYNLLFNANGGEVDIESKSVIFDSEFGELPTPTRTGYTFGGWFVDALQADEKTVFTNVGDIELKAAWIVNEYTIKYFVDGTEVKTQNVFFGESINDYTYERRGYTVSAWTPSLPATMPAEDIVVNATTTPKNYSVRYLVDGVVTETSSEAFDSYVDIKAEPSKEGYTFSGWEVTGAAEINGNRFKMSDEVVYVSGCFTPNTYTVKFVADEGEDSTLTQKFTYDTEGTLIGNTFTKTGYSFNGWLCGDKTYADGGIVKNLTAEANGTVTFVAQWKINSYTVTFDTDGGTTIPEITQDYNSEIVAPESPTKEGFRFVGWDAEIPERMPAENLTIKATWESYLDMLLGLPDFNGDNLTVATEYYMLLNEEQKEPFVDDEKFGEFEEALITVSVDKLNAAVKDAVDPTNELLKDTEGSIATLTLDNKHVDVRFDMEDYLAVNVANINFLSSLFGYKEVESITIGSNTVTLTGNNSSDQIQIMLAVAKEANVNLSEASTTTVSVLDGKKMEVTLNCVTAGDIEYSSTYELEFFNNRHNVTWNVDGGVILGEEHSVGLTPYNTDIVAPTVSKPGYDFNGWDMPIGKMGREDVTFTAQWTPHTFTVTYDVNGGNELSETTAQVIFGNKLGTQPVPTRFGYTFEAWYLGENKITADTEYTFVEDITLTAHWTPNTHRIVYKVDGTVLYEDLASFDSVVTVRADETKENYTFSGWVVSGADESDGKFVMPDNTVEITGTFSYDLFTVFFDSDGGTTVDSITAKRRVALGDLAKPEKIGYAFEGWFLDDTEVTASTVFDKAEDITLTARYNTVAYSIAYVGEGTFDESNPNEYTVESADITLVNPTREHYEFIGWTQGTSDEPAVSVVIKSGSVGDMTFTANWKAIEYEVTFEAYDYYTEEETDDIAVEALERNAEEHWIKLTVNDEKQDDRLMAIVIVERNGVEEIIVPENGVYKVTDIFEDTTVRVATVMKGDTDLNNKIDAKDLAEIANIISDNEGASAGTKLISDINSDGSVTKDDLLKLMNFLVGNTDTLG